VDISRCFLTPKGLPQSNNGSAPPHIPTPASVGGNFRRCSVRFMLRPAWLLAFLDWSDLTELVGRRRRVRPSLPQRRSLTSRVGYDYTASPDGYCGRTSTGWSAAVTGCALLTLVRGHWQIENQSQWVRDVTFDEDRSQVRCGHIPQVMAALRNTAIGLMRWAGETNIAGACRRFAAQPVLALELIGIQLEN
jgi:hypothetical protein